MTCGACSRPAVSVALVHYPVYDKNRQVVATAVTNLDIHDISRSARTFGLNHYYLVTPVEGQKELAGRIIRHWREGWGASYNPKRKAALDLVRISNSIEEVLEELGNEYGAPARLVTTGARQHPRSIGYEQMASIMTHDREHPYLIVFGTGWGLTEDFFDRSDFVLAPIQGPGEYNHLSVRSAAAIIMDRLFGVR
ncbi:RNA methyltransferase [Geobacter sulfurreducens]|uniref:RNA methyltransferase n=1 Tax=Geobacter sulfurreducens TaxID=35554 RepID=UPI000DBBADC1|nr:RNA methyltransferase [Geobacter sulfurreducens]BBA69182.1 hypothetical protein YM18_0628 [Geobacter sulfurreducens]